MNENNQSPNPNQALNNISTNQKTKNPFKLLTLILVFLVVGLLVGIAYLIMYGNSNNASKTTSYSVDLSTKAISRTSQKSEDGIKVLTLNDISDSFSDKYFTIKEWGLKIKTKYADLLEYDYIKRGKDWVAESTPYAACNGTYFYCDSIVAVKIKDQYIDMKKQQQANANVYTDSSTSVWKTFLDGLRTMAYIYQDNLSLSFDGATKYRLWTNDAFKTEFGTTGTLLFEAQTPVGIDELGKATCGINLNVALDSNYPCEDITLSLHRFDAAKI